ncbi:unnamed protein product [Ectocarpus sp. CCAP 1310/34]|nr:unnamed protein product [Ectocarpus sp. CCAP 1310/34]
MGGDLISKQALFTQKKKEVKNEGLKRAAEASTKAQQSGEVQVTDKPPEMINEEVASRPAKRSRGGDEEDMEVVGTTGTAKLPHNRFACTEVRCLDNVGWRIGKIRVVQKKRGTRLKTAEHDSKASGLALHKEMTESHAEFSKKIVEEEKEKEEGYQTRVRFLRKMLAGIEKVMFGDE